MSVEEIDNIYLEDLLIRQIIRQESDFFKHHIDSEIAENIIVKLSGIDGWGHYTNFSFINFLTERMHVNQFPLFGVKPDKGIIVLKGDDKLSLYDIVYPLYKDTYEYGNLLNQDNLYNNIFDAAFRSGFYAFDPKSPKTEFEFSQERLPYIEAFSDKFIHIYQNIDKLKADNVNDYHVLTKLFYNYNEHYLNTLLINSEKLELKEKNSLYSLFKQKNILESYLAMQPNIITPYLESKIHSFNCKTEYEMSKFHKSFLHIISDFPDNTLHNKPRL